MTILEIILTITCCILFIVVLLLSLNCDEQEIQIKRDEQWKAAADREIKMLEARGRNAIDYALKVEMESIKKK